MTAPATPTAPTTRTADDLLKAAKRSPVVKVENVPQWGTVYIRGLSTHEYTIFDSSGVKVGSDTYAAQNAVMLRYGIVDENGKHIFGDEHIEDLADLPAEVTRPIIKALYRACGVGVDLGN